MDEMSNIQILCACVLRKNKRKKTIIIVLIAALFQ